MQLAFILSLFLRNFNYDFPKFSRKQFYHQILFLPHKIAPKKTLHEKSISDTEPFFQNCSTLPTPSEFTDFLVQHISLASQSLFPLLVNFNMKRDKNRVAQFYTKIDFSKLNFNGWLRVLFLDSPRSRFFTFYKFLKFLLISLSLFQKRNYFRLCTISIWTRRRKISEHDHFKDTARIRKDQLINTKG